LPIISLIREGFAEAPIILESLQNHMPHQIITPEQFFQGDWDFLHQPMHPPRTNVKLAKDGNEAIAQAVVAFFNPAS
jgi:hypothetical protein